MGLPVYQGYGLSESASVTCINAPEKNVIGSVGTPLPHVTLDVADDGELWLHDPLFLGYVGEESAPAYYATGDIGRIDTSGYVYITGRKKHVLITANGRNISPEWPESVLLSHPAIVQAVVVGDAQPYLAALIVSDAPDETIACAVHDANQTLPDYARIKRWQRINPLSAENECLTGTGRARRTQINQHYHIPITSLFERNP
jgi:long-subunit acyl-CoA synthetase (AMP-forming)